MTLTAGYAATSSSTFTVTGTPAPTVTKESGDAAITWNDTTKTLDIAAGLVPGTYPVELKAANNIEPDAAITITLEVEEAPPLAPSITGDTAMKLNLGYKAASTSAYTITGTEPVEITQDTDHGGKIVYNPDTKKLDIKEGLAAGKYIVILTAANDIEPEASFTFTLTVTDSPQTGDGGSMTGWAIILSISMLGVAYTLIRRRRAL